MPTIRELRQARGWSQFDLANASGVSNTAISRLERGIAVNRSTFRLLCIALNVPMEDVTGVVVSDKVAAARRRDGNRNVQDAC
jgi:transcriptional regulator with XRE-family HTH domain